MRLEALTSSPPQTSASFGERMSGLLKGLLGLAALFLRGSSSSSSSSAAARFLVAFFLGFGSALTLEPLEAGAALGLEGVDLAGAGLAAGAEGGGGSVSATNAAETWESKASGCGCGGGAVVRVGGGLWWSGHAFGDVVEAVADDFVDGLLACAEVEAWGQSGWWEGGELGADLFGRDGAEVGVVEDLDDGGTEDGDGGRVERMWLRHGCKRERVQGSVVGTSSLVSSAEVEAEAEVAAEAGAGAQENKVRECVGRAAEPG
ncbi:hypothetical protein L1887_57753 [Cichorium endivia]|nr:hypothetical protein L1887_57753 [Cichorium endivia]